ncbi:uncharacterized protein J3D65DRAFT_660587 [Phyllosticta citribraziliensis]|uniref:Uncharacterized protein n=1 Tax=Phyllosticta citribraziliensis TaxID=989973 RepID=A0ABR1LG64_9PEZI
MQERETPELPVPSPSAPHGAGSFEAHLHSFQVTLNAAHPHSFQGSSNAAFPHSFQDPSNAAHPHSFQGPSNAAHPHSFPGPSSGAYETFWSESDTQEDSDTLLSLRKTKEEDVRLPPEVEKLFQKEQPAALLCSPNTSWRRLTSSGETPSFLNATSLGEHYKLTQELQSDAEPSTVLRRFVVTVYFDVISALSRPKRYTRHVITKRGISLVAAAIRENSEFSSAKIARHLWVWAKQGIVFRQFANKLGGTACFFFMPGTGHTKWIYDLRRAEDDEVVAILRRHGIA